MKEFLETIARNHYVSSLLKTTRVSVVMKLLICFRECLSMIMCFIIYFNLIGKIKE